MTRKKEKQPIIDVFNILYYFAAFVICSLIAYWVKLAVLRGISQSPTGQVGNGFLVLSEVHNTGAAFNLFSNQPEMIITASFLAVAVISFIVLIASARINQTAISAMALLSSGITMNMIERINQGYVIDYIHCLYVSNLPVFNVPDIMIFAGALGLILAILTGR